MLYANLLVLEKYSRHCNWFIVELFLFYFFFYVAVCCSFCRVVNTLHATPAQRCAATVDNNTMPNDRGKQEASGSRGRGSSGSAMLLAAAEATTATAAVAEEREKKKRQKRLDSKTRALFFFHFISFCAIGLLTVCVERQNVSKCNQNTRTHRTHTITPIGRVCVRTKDRERKKRVRSSLVCVRCWECVCICVELNSTNDGEFDDTVFRTHAHKMVVGSACGEFERTQRNHFCLCARRRLCLSECVCVCVFSCRVCVRARVFTIVRKEAGTQ